jgi:hypothetical protein
MENYFRVRLTGKDLIFIYFSFFLEILDCFCKVWFGLTILVFLNQNQTEPSLFNNF